MDLYADLLTTGPQFAFSTGSPTPIFATRSFSRETKTSYTRASTMAREQAEHFCPLNPNADAATPSTAASRSQSTSTMMESLPPISKIVRLIQICPGCVLAARSLMSRPTSFDPVNEINRVFGCSPIALPNEPPEPGQKFTTPSGMPASSRTSTNFAAIVGESLDGFRITVLPVTIEAAVMPAIIAKGKFHGGITAPTPSGMY